MLIQFNNNNNVFVMLLICRILFLLLAYSAHEAFVTG